MEPHKYTDVLAAVFGMNTELREFSDQYVGITCSSPTRREVFTVYLVKRHDKREVKGISLDVDLPTNMELLMV